MIIAIIANMKKEPARALCAGISDFLKKRTISVVSDDNCCDSIGAAPLSSVPPSEISFIIAMGGDGSILHLIHRHPNLDAPIFAINLGGLGFMADISRSDVYPCLEDLLDGKYRIDERVMLQGESPDGSCTFTAVNDVVIHRSPNPCIIDLSVHINGNYLNTFAADGIIVATPTGSTAYSLAAGGPILSSTIDAFVLTPISPHTISNRPFVFGTNQKIKIQYLSDHAPVEVTFDGIAAFSLATGDTFTITRAARSFKLITLHKHDAFATLREKLNWSGRLRTR